MLLSTIKPGFYLGVDGGGTKTEAVIANESGFILARGVAEGANIHNYSVDVACDHVMEAIHKALSQAQKDHPHLNIQWFEAAGVGLAGIDSDGDRQLVSEHIFNLPKERRLCFTKRMVLVNDGLIALKAGTDREWGVCLIASTGCNVYGVNLRGEEATAGDWGYILGDQASGYALGQFMLRQVVKENDGRAPESPLTRLVLEQLQLGSVSELIPWTYGDKVPVKEIAGLAAIASNESLVGHVALHRFVDSQVVEFVEAYKAVIARLGLSRDAEIPLVLVGGLYSLNELFTKKVVYEIQLISPKATITFPSKSPAEGGVKIAHAAIMHQVLPNSAVQFVNHEFTNNHSC